VSAKIESIVENGLNVTFGNGVMGSIFIDHLKTDLSKYKKKKHLLARVISMDFEKKL
jgi:ribosomal protein S1